MERYNNVYGDKLKGGKKTRKSPSKIAPTGTKKVKKSDPNSLVSANA